MSKRFVVVAAVALMAAPAYASDVGTQGGGSPLVQQAANLIALGAVTPEAPILSGAEGATDSGGRSVFVTALYGGLIGAAIGTAVALIEGGNYGRDIGIGAGVGILAGAVLGATEVLDRNGPYPASDGMGSTDRYPVITGHEIAIAGNF